MVDGGGKLEGSRPGRSCWASLGARVHYVDYGGPPAGPVIVCVHGLGSSGRTWALVAPRLAMTHRVLALDLAGFGHSKRSGLAVSVPANQALVARFLQQVAKEPAILAGHSMGGTIAALVTARHPELTSGLVLIDPVIPWLRDEVERRLADVRAAVAGAVRPGGRYAASAQARLAMRSPVAAAGMSWTGLTARLIEQYRGVTHEAAWNRWPDVELLAAARSLTWTLLRRREFAAMLAAIDVPVLWLHGENDPLVPLGAARQAACGKPSWQLTVGRGMGHEPHREAPEWAIMRITEWLRHQETRRLPDERRLVRPSDLSAPRGLTFRSGAQDVGVDEPGQQRLGDQ